MSHLLQVIAHHSVIVVEMLSEMGSEVERLHVGLAEVSGPAYFDLAHLHLVSNGGSGHTEVSLV